MADESTSGNTPPAFTFGEEETPSTIQEFFDALSCTSDCGTTICDDSFGDLWNALNSHSDARDVTGHTHVTDSGITNSPPMVSSTSINHAQPSTSRAGMKEASAILENIARNAPGTGGREQRELCGACGNVSSRRDALHGHAKEHADDAAQICKVCHQSSVKISKVVEHCRNRTGKKHKCETCSKEFHRAEVLTQHNRTHTNERPHKCQMCNKSFRRSSHLDEHKRTHTDERPYKCQLCNKSFRRSNHLDNHKRKHRGEKPYICKTCGKSFAQLATLRTHENTHAEEKRHVCQNCAKSFKNNSALKRHVDS
nr:zinc finger protein 22-like isoform X2 [Dermacentor andersoni]